jgi:PII-like signaling protein
VLDGQGARSKEICAADLLKLMARLNVVVVVVDILGAVSQSNNTHDVAIPRDATTSRLRNFGGCCRSQSSSRFQKRT